MASEKAYQAHNELPQRAYDSEEKAADDDVNVRTLHIGSLSRHVLTSCLCSSI